MSLPDPSTFSATDAAHHLRAGRLTATDLTNDCLARIRARDGLVRAWAHVATDTTDQIARAPAGPLHGIPIGLKDVIDTADQPTAYGCAAFAGHQPEADAECVTLLRAAGAIILGKLHTAELATYHPGPTANPLNPAHTPGGSSSGSAAAVADFHVPLALGTQTVASMLRPGSFCGIHGFKPTLGRYPTAGLKATSHTMDTLGVFARALPDLLLIDSILAPRPPAPAAPNGHAILIARTPAWEQASPAMRAAFDSCAAALAAAGIPVIDRPLPDEIEAVYGFQADIHARDVHDLLGNLARDHPDQVSDAFKALVAKGAAISDDRHDANLDALAAAKRALPALFDGIAAILSPAATAIAPAGLASTGDPSFSRIWTAIGTPCLGFPWGHDQGLPLGLQLIGAPDSDRALIHLTIELLSRIHPA
ncbi:amidase [Polymorphobacter sp.]|uniref:amidase n=1 Tax=Polymorphobacter sp. TaxID=1909290 RepID=UPI003F715580